MMKKIKIWKIFHYNQWKILKQLIIPNGRIYSKNLFQSASENVGELEHPTKEKVHCHTIKSIKINKKQFYTNTKIKYKLWI